MTSIPPEQTADVPVREDHEHRVHLLMEDGRNRRLLAESLAGDYVLTQSETLSEESPRFDLCIVDGSTLETAATALADRKEREGDVFLPILLLDGSEAGTDPSVWNYVDDLFSTPVRKAELRARITNLLDRRATSVELSRREQELEATVSELERTKRAIDAAPIGITMTDPAQSDNPTVYANAAFERITGYDREEIYGENMRHLQGPATDDDAVGEMREAIDAAQPVSVTLANYKADGTQFWNRVDIAPVRDDDGDVTNYVGFQTDVTDEKIREQRLSVLNRLMRHNLSNDLNVVSGYVDLLLEEIDDPEHVNALREIERAATKLNSLGQEARRVERLIDRCRRFEQPVDVEEVVGDVRTEMTERYPDVHFSLDVEGGPWHVNGPGIDVLVTELVENAIENNDGSNKAVRVSVRAVDGSDDRISVCIADNGPGIPPEVADIIHDGEETPLKHGDRLGLWLVYWIVTLIGGRVTFDTHSGDGTTVCVTLPAIDPDSE